MNRTKGGVIINVIGIIIIVFITLGFFYAFSHRANAPLTDETDVDFSSTTTPGVSQPSTSTTSVTTVSTVNLYYIALEQPGSAPVGCGDGIVATRTQIAPTAAPLQAALTALLSNHAKTVGNNYNALSGSSLKLDSAAISSGKATVKLSGTVSLGGVCDAPRFIAQIRQTVMQFSTISSTDISVNSQPLETIGSEKGGN